MSSVENNDKINETLQTSYVENCSPLENNLIYNSYYTSGLCLSNKDPENNQSKINIIKKMESNFPKTLIISRNQAGEVLYVMYTPNIATDTSKFPFSSHTPNNQIINMFMILSITEDDIYSLNPLSSDPNIPNYSYDGSLKYYINGVILDNNNNFRLSTGDHILCVEFDTTKSTNPLQEIALRKNKSLGDANILSEVVVKSINFVSKVSNNYNNALSNACTPDNYLTSKYCKDLIKNDTILNDLVKNNCLIAKDGSFAFIGSTICSNIIDSAMNKSVDINSLLSKDIYNAVSGWVYKNLSSSVNLSAMNDLEISRLNSIFDILKKQSDGLAIMNNSDVQVEIAKYCSESAGDVFDIADDNTLCGKIYNNADVSEYRKEGSSIGDSIKNIKYNYCTQTSNSINGGFRYENDDKCLEEMKRNDFMKNTINERCYLNTKWGWTDPYCRNIDGGVDYSVIIYFLIILVFSSVGFYFYIKKSGRFIGSRKINIKIQ
jgi:hypothetical protein